ncbi:MAG: hypothetical protein J6J60_00740 [Clostridia bacterium]|nr:hypothetical protein [Clostridia bacterium]
MKFNVKIELDKVILIGNDPNYKINYKSEIETKWLLIKEIKDKIFCLKSSEINNYGGFVQKIKESNYEIIDVEKRIREKARDIVDREFNKIFEENKDAEDMVLEYDIKEKVDKETGEIIPYKDYRLINEAYLFGRKIREDEYRTRYLNLGISQIDKGIISVMNDEILYDLTKDKFISSDREVLLAFYNKDEIRHIISYDKYKLGIGSDFYKEIAKINEFMKDKKTITVALKNGTEFKIENAMRDILDIFSDGEIYVSRTYNQKIIKGENFESYQYKANEIKSIKYGKLEVDIDGDKLILNRK